jgi:hypothetical protein
VVSQRESSTPITPSAHPGRRARLAVDEGDLLRPQRHQTGATHFCEMRVEGE